MTNETQPQRPLTQGLTRVREGAILGGVAGGLAKRFDVSSSWIQLGFIITTFFGGLGVLLYLVGWVAIPEEGAESSIAEDFLSGLSNKSGWLGGALIVLAAAILIGAADLFSGRFVLAAGLLLAGFMLYRGQGTKPAPGDAGPPPELGPGPAAEPFPTSDRPFDAGAPGGVPAAARADTAEGSSLRASSPYWASSVTEVYGDRSDPGESGTLSMTPAPVSIETAPPPPRAPKPARPRSYLGRLTMACMLIAIGVLALLRNLGTVDLEARHFASAGMLVIGLGLLVGSFFGRARGLILVGLIGVPILVVATTVRVPLDGPWGEQEARPAAVAELEAEYEHGIGSFVLDLTDIDDLTEATAVSVDQGIGELRVLVPADLSVSVDASVDAGRVEVFGREDGGFDVSVAAVSESYPGTAGEPTLDLELDLGVGRIAVVRQG
ncbi:MAG: PspC domain-containing protein [Acidimicrobiia bacterium]